MVNVSSAIGLDDALARLAIEKLRSAPVKKWSPVAPSGRTGRPPESEWQDTESAVTIAAFAIALSGVDDKSAAEIAGLAGDIDPVVTWQLHNSSLQDCRGAVVVLKEALRTQRDRVLASLRDSVDWATNSPSKVLHSAVVLSELGEQAEAEALLAAVPKEHFAQPLLIAARVAVARNGGYLSEALDIALSGLRQWPGDTLLRSHLRPLCIRLHRLTDLEWPNTAANPDTNVRDAIELVEDLLRQNNTSAALETLWARRDLLFASASGFFNVVRLLVSEFKPRELCNSDELARFVGTLPVGRSLALQVLLPYGSRNTEGLLAIGRRASVEATNDLQFWKRLCRSVFSAVNLAPPQNVQSPESADWILARCSSTPVDDLWTKAGASAGYNMPVLDMRSLEGLARVRRQWDHGRRLNYRQARESLSPRSRSWLEKLRRGRLGAFVFTVHAHQEVGLQNQLLPVAACAYGLRATGVRRWATRTDHPGERYLEQLPLAPEYISRRSAGAIDLATQLTGAVRAAGIVHLPIDFVDGWHSYDTVVVPGYVRPYEIGEFSGRVALMSEGSVAFGASYLSRDEAWTIDIHDVALPPPNHAIGTRSKWLLQRVARAIRQSYLQQRIPLASTQIGSSGGAPISRVLVETRQFAQTFPDVRKSLFGRLLLDEAFSLGSLAIRGESSEVTFAELRRRSLSCAGLILHYQELKSSHVTGRCFRDQHRVLAVLPPGEALAEIGLGALAAGSLFCICHPDVDAEILRRRFADFKPDLTIITASAADEFLKAGHAIEGAVLVCDDTGDGETAEDLIVGFEPARRLPPFEPDRPALVVFTSGSTGVPKGVVVSQRLHSVGYDDVEKIVEDSRYAVIARWDTIAFAGVLTTLRRGSTVHVVPRNVATSPPLLVGYLGKRRITALSAPSTIWHGLAEHDSFAAATLPSFRGGVAWGERLTGAAVKKIAAKFAAIWLAITFGATEASHVSSRVLIDHGRLVEDTGSMLIQPHAGTTLRIVDDAGTVVSSPPQAGRLEITGPNVMVGYFDDLYAKNEPVEAGKIRSVLLEDLVSPAADGAPILVGRADSVLKIGGRRISLTEIEMAAESIPQVRRAVAIAREGDLTPEIWLALEGKPDMGRRDIADHVSGMTASEARPRRVKLFERFPVLETGKIDLVELQRHFEGNNKKKYGPKTTRVDGTLPVATAALSEIKDWLKSHDYVDQDDEDIAANSLADSYIDSLLQLELLMFLENKFGVNINHEYLVADSTVTFGSLATALARTVGDRGQILGVPATSGNPRFSSNIREQFAAPDGNIDVS